MSDGEPTMRELMLVENPRFEDVMRCVFGIQDHETETYLALLDEPGTSAAHLAETLDRDRSNVSRSLDTLREKGLTRRRREVLDAGGDGYCYWAEPLADVKERMHEDLDAWTAEVHGYIDGFGAPER